jgi:predicted dehydrogenase
MAKRYIQVGTGGFGRYWCRGIYPKIADAAVPVAAVDINPDVHQNAVEFLGLSPEVCYTNVKEALDRHPADFVVVVVPAKFHEEVIDEALAHGMDIVCEKPLADNMEGCVRIYNKVKAAGRKLVVTMSHRYEVEKQTVESMVKSGDYGKLNYLVSRLTMKRNVIPDPKILNPIDLLVNGLVHNLDTARGVCGCNAKTVFADCWNFTADDGTTGSASMVQAVMENGTRAQFEESFGNASTLNKWSDEYLRAECADGTIVADNRKVTLQNHRGFPYPVLAEIPLRSEAYWDHALIVRSFIDWLDGGKAPDTQLEDNIQCCALLFAAVESANTGKVVDVQEFLKRHM